MERSQQTDRNEFWATVDKPERGLVASASALAAWERHYNESRSHSSLSGKTPHAWYQERASLVPTPEVVAQQFAVSQEKWHTNWPYSWTFTPDKGFFLKRCR